MPVLASARPRVPPPGRGMSASEACEAPGVNTPALPHCSLGAALFDRPFSAAVDAFFPSLRWTPSRPARSLRRIRSRAASAGAGAEVRPDAGHHASLSLPTRVPVEDSCGVNTHGHVGPSPDRSGELPRPVRRTGREPLCRIGRNRTGLRPLEPPRPGTDRHDGHPRPLSGLSSAARLRHGHASPSGRPARPHRPCAALPASCRPARRAPCRLHAGRGADCGAGRGSDGRMWTRVGRTDPPRHARRAQ